MKKPKVILIGGASCAGKTSLAKEIEASLHLKTYIFHQDNFSKDFSSYTEKEIDKLNFDKPNIYDFNKLILEVNNLKNGLPFLHKTYDFISKRSIEQKISESFSKSIELIIIEGIYVLRNKKLLKLADLSVFIDVDDNILINRRLKRDTEERGYDFKESLDRYMRDVLPSYNKYIKPTKSNATFIINGNKKFQNVFKNLKSIVLFNKD